MSGHIDVVVIGGGYAGVMAANRLTQRADVAVTLVNPRASFVERVRLHQVAGGRTRPSSTTGRSWPNASGWWSTRRS